MKTKKGKNTKSKKYLKAVHYYEEGELKKAINLCDECISENLKNSSALNLKGLILYSQGDLAGARSQWKINSDHNDDTLAKNYLFDSLKDFPRAELYKEAERDIKELRIEEAFNKLKACKESDFNSIKVNLALALCYFRRADYNGCGDYLSKVFAVDKNNESAKKLAKDLKKFNKVAVNTNSSGNFGKSIGIAAIVLCLLVASGVSFSLIKSYLSTRPKTIVESTPATKEEDKLQTEISEEVNESEDKGETKYEEIIDFDKLSDLIDEKNYDGIYEMLANVNVNSLTGENKSTYYTGKQLLEKEGVEYFYKKGYDLYIKKSYDAASREFTKGCTYGKENYLYQHLIFFNAASYEAINNKEEAIKYYEEYYKHFHDADYIAEAIYKLAILYKNKDIDKAVAYAEELKYDYSSSMYNNDVISDLIKSVK